MTRDREFNKSTETQFKDAEMKDPGLRAATVPVRLIAHVADVVLTAPLFILIWLFMRHTFSLMIYPYDGSFYYYWALLVLYYNIAYTLLHGLLLHFRGQTIGKCYFDIRITRLDQQPATIWQLLVIRSIVNQWLVCIPLVGQIYGVINFLSLLSDDHRCVHDHLAGTMVVDLLPPSEQPSEAPTDDRFHSLRDRT